MKKLLIGLCLLPLCFIGQTKDEVLKELKKAETALAMGNNAYYQE